MTIKMPMSYQHMSRKKIINNGSLSKIFKEYHYKRVNEVERLVKFTDTLASFIHGGGLLKNNFIGLSFLILELIFWYFLFFLEY